MWLVEGWFIFSFRVITKVSRRRRRKETGSRAIEKTVRKRYAIKFFVTYTIVDFINSNEIVLIFTLSHLEVLY